MLNAIGWLATALVAGSYFCRQGRSMRLLQAMAALLWIGYGVLIGAPPVIAANVIVAALAAFTGWRAKARTTGETVEISSN